MPFRHLCAPTRRALAPRSAHHHHRLTPLTLSRSTSFSSSGDSARHSTTPRAAASNMASETILYTHPSLATLRARRAALFALPPFAAFAALPSPLLALGVSITALLATYTYANRRLGPLVYQIRTPATHAPTADARTPQAVKAQGPRVRASSSFLEAGELLSRPAAGTIDPTTPLVFTTSAPDGSLRHTTLTPASLRRVGRKGLLGRVNYVVGADAPLTGGAAVGSAVGGGPAGVGGIGETHRGERERDGVEEEVVIASTRDEKGEEVGRVEARLRDLRKGLEAVSVGRPRREFWIRVEGGLEGVGKGL